ncbi:hypothetical protein AAEX28_08060 [Lentisphaerota bacterium WC36G]|nr:hypothetical protein LJT99_10915 [Lentisphaerae bacterium WC36]
MKFINITLIIFVCYLTSHVLAAENNQTNSQNPVTKKTQTEHVKPEPKTNNALITIYGNESPSYAFLANFNNKTVIITTSTNIFCANKIKFKTMDNRTLTIKNIYFHKSKDLAVITINNKNITDLTPYKICKARAKDLLALKQFSDEVEINKKSQISTIDYNELTLKNNFDKTSVNGTPLLNNEGVVAITLSFNDQILAPMPSLKKFSINHRKYLRLDNISPKDFHKLTAKNSKDIKIYKQLRAYNKLLFKHITNFAKAMILYNPEYYETIAAQNPTFKYKSFMEYDMPFNLFIYNNNQQGINFAKKWNHWLDSRLSNPTTLFISLKDNLKYHYIKSKKHKYQIAIITQNDYLLPREVEINNKLKQIITTVQANVSDVYKKATNSDF